MKVVPLRLAPGDDLRQTLETWMGEQQEQAGCVISAVGSLSVAQLRFAGAAEDTTIHGELEILSLAGTLSPDGAHLHIAVADSTWPTIKNINDYNNLPPHIKQECEQVLGLTVLRLDQHNPNCPRFVLREFFKIGFKQPELNGLMQQQASMKYDASCDVYHFPFHAFYVPKLFVAEIELISKWMEVDSVDLDKIGQLHAQFLQRQPYAQSRQKC